MEVEEPFPPPKNTRRARRRDLNLLDPNLEESDGADTHIPEVGMVFNDHVEVNRFYRKYARRVGFGVSVRRSSFSQEGTCLYLELMCCKGGRPRCEPKFRKRASSTTNCPAKIRVKLWGDKLLHVELAILDHNHPVSPAMARFLNSKQRSGPAKKRLRMGGPGAMPVEEPSKMPVDKLDELEELLFGETKQPSFVERGRLKLQPGDSEALRIFFTRMQAKNANFFNVIDMDDEGCVRNVFWADARSRTMYEYYNDVITLDTSYLVSKYDLPLVTLIGINHHGQSILLGCALLSDETAETYSWLFKAWIACMSGNLPKAVITDYCRGIQSAINEVIPGARHRMCLFQIMRRTAERLGGLSEYRAINKAMQKAIYDSLTINDFEEDWNKLITYNSALQNNDWLRSLYEVRSSWVPVFIKETFWAGMSTTQRNETITPFFDGCVELKTSLKQFLGKYEMVLQSKHEKVAQADFETFHKQRPPVSKFYMEEQLSKVYTHNMFKKFQAEIEAIMYCHVSVISADGPISTFNVKECIFLEDGKRTMSKIFEVTYNAEEKDITCICGGFQLCGILCRHSLAMLKFHQVREIPPRYILDRWKKDFRQLHVMGRVASDVALNNRFDRYDHLSMRCLQLVDSADLSDKYHLAFRLVREMEKFLLNSKTHDETQPKIRSRIPNVNKPSAVTSQNVVGATVGNGNDRPQGPKAPAVTQASQIQKGGVENGIVPASYIGLPANVQQFVSNQAAIQPSIVYMVPSGIDPQAFGNGVLMPVMYQHMFQVPQKPNETVQGTSANGEKKRSRSQKPTETYQQPNGTLGPTSG